MRKKETKGEEKEGKMNLHAHHLTSIRIRSIAARILNNVR